jgi:hypothetical protein
LTIVRRFSIPAPVQTNLASQRQIIRLRQTKFSRLQKPQNSALFISYWQCPQSGANLFEMNRDFWEMNQNCSAINN